MDLTLLRQLTVIHENMPPWWAEVNLESFIQDIPFNQLVVLACYTDRPSIVHAAKFSKMELDFLPQQTMEKVIAVVRASIKIAQRCPYIDRRRERIQRAQAKLRQLNDLYNSHQAYRYSSRLEHEDQLERVLHMRQDNLLRSEEEQIVNFVKQEIEVLCHPTKCKSSFFYLNNQAYDRLALISNKKTSLSPRFFEAFFRFILTYSKKNTTVFNELIQSVKRCEELKQYLVKDDYVQLNHIYSLMRYIAHLKIAPQNIQSTLELFSQELEIVFAILPVCSRKRLSVEVINSCLVQYKRLFDALKENPIIKEQSLDPRNIGPINMLKLFSIIRSYSQEKIDSLIQHILDDNRGVNEGSAQNEFNLFQYIIDVGIS